MLIDIMDDHGLEQLVHFPTREKNTLDLILMSLPGQFQEIQSPYKLSDHDVVSGTLKVYIPPPPPKKKRNFGGRCIYITKDFESIRKDVSDFAKDRYFNGYSDNRSIQENFIICIFFTAYTWNLHYHVWSSTVYVTQALTSMLLLALVATVFTPNKVRTVFIFIVILHWYTSVWWCKYLTMIMWPWSHFQGHLSMFSIMDSGHVPSSAYCISLPPPTLTQLPAYMDLLSQGWGSGTYFYFQNNEAPHFSISDRMYRWFNLCFDDAQAQ